MSTRESTTAATPQPSVTLAGPSNDVVEPTEASDAPNPRRWLIFITVSVALFMASIDQTIVATALPTIQKDLHAGLNWSGWTITIYALGQVLVMPVAGKISDQLGRKKVFLIAAVIFTVSSLACGFANDIYVLVGLRAIQAIGGGAFMPSAYGLVGDAFARDRDRALGMFTSIFPIGAIVGPVIGGVFVSYWSWRGIFLVNVPIGVILIAMTVKFVPRTAPRVAAGIDVRGVLLLGLLILSTMFGITWLGTGNTEIYSPLFLISEAVAIFAGYLFVRHSKRDPNAFIPIKILRGHGFAVTNFLNVLLGAGAMGFGALVPLYAELRYGMHPLSAGTLLTARAIGIMCVAAIAAFALRRTGYRAPMVAGFTIAAIGMVQLWLPTPHGVTPYVWLSIGAALTGVGMGVLIPAANNASLQLAPDQIASISGLRGMFRQGGGIIAVSVTTAVVNRSADPGITLSHFFLIFAIVQIALLPLVFLIPEHKGRW